MRGILTVVCLLLVTTGCSGFLRKAHRAYEGGRYFEAIEVLSTREPDLYELGPRERVDYGVTRGRAHARLSDFGEATRWLRFASEVVRANPGDVRERDRVAVSEAYAELSAAMGILVGPDTETIRGPVGSVPQTPTP